MTREELIRSKEYWITLIQLSLFEEIEKFKKLKGFNRSALARELGVTKGYISQVLNGDFDHRISKLVDLSLAIGKAPILRFDGIEDIIEYENRTGNNYVETMNRPIQYNNMPYNSVVKNDFIPEINLRIGVINDPKKEAIMG